MNGVIQRFMQRFAAGCSSESHPLYPTFMSRLSGYVFNWDSEDFQRLYAAKQSKLRSKDVSSVQKEDASLHVTKKRRSLHCKCHTRGIPETTHLIKELINVFASNKGKDTMGIPLLNSGTIKQIWKEQQHHITCIWDPEGVPLYSKTGTFKGGHELPFTNQRDDPHLSSHSTITLIA